MGNSVLLAKTSGSSVGGLSSILLLVGMIAIMYFLLIRPQRKREKETKNMRNSVKVGDKIVTIGGICGKVVKVRDESLIIVVGSQKTRMEVMRWSISSITESTRTSDDIAEDFDEDAPHRKAPRRMKPKAEEKEPKTEEKETKAKAEEPKADAEEPKANAEEPKANAEADETQPDSEAEDNAADDDSAE